MGSGSSVPVDSDKVSALLQALPEEERKGLAVISPSLADKISPDRGNGENDENDDANNGGGGVPQQIKVKVARMVVAAMARSPESGRIAMHGNMERMLLELPRLLHDMTLC